jgi:hypothetical protein
MTIDTLDHAKKLEAAGAIVYLFPEFIWGISV